MDFNIGDRIKDEKRDLTITDKNYFTQGNRRAWYYKYHCNICGYDCDGGYRGGEFKQAPWFSKDQLGRKKSNCPCCMHKIIVPHINSIRATNPELSQYFLDDDDIKYSVYSNMKRNLKCPFCGTVKENMTISSLARQGFACPVCSDGISIGERIMYYILNDSKMDFKKEFMFPDNDWRYDFYIYKYNAIIEIHGEQHYKQTTFGDLCKTQQNDVNKRDYALNNGIEKYIIINAMKSDFDYIVNSIISSDFSTIYDLSSIDWMEIRKKIFSDNIAKNICTYWEEHKDATYVDMERIFNFSEHTIRKYLQIGYKLGWCNKDQRNNRCILVRSRPILYIPKNIYFKNIELYSRLSEELFGERISSSTVRYKIKRNNECYMFISKEEFNKAFYNGECCYGTPFGKNLLKTS